VKYLRENGYNIEAIGALHSVPSKSSDGAHIVQGIQTYQYPRNHPKLDVAQHSTEIWACDCKDFVHRRSVDVSEQTLANGKLEKCKHIKQIVDGLEGLEKCPECGLHFERLAKHLNGGHSKHMDPRTLGKLYWGQNMSLREVAEQLNTNSGTISEWMKKFGIEKRSKSDAKGGYQFTSEELENLYHSQEKTTVEIGEEYDLDPSTVSRKLKKHGVETREGLAKAKEWSDGVYWDYGPDWKERREERLDVDDNWCVVCGMTMEQHKEKHGKELCVHHIQARSSFVEGGEVQQEANDVNNLITLCEKCHRKWEGVPLKPDI